MDSLSEWDTWTSFYTQLPTLASCQSILRGLLTALKKFKKIRIKAPLKEEKSLCFWAMERLDQKPKDNRFKSSFLAFQGPNGSLDVFSKDESRCLSISCQKYLSAFLPTPLKLSHWILWFYPFDVSIMIFGSVASEWGSCWEVSSRFFM